MVLSDVSNTQIISSCQSSQGIDSLQLCLDREQSYAAYKEAGDFAGLVKCAANIVMALCLSVTVGTRLGEWLDRLVKHLSDLSSFKMLDDETKLQAYAAVMHGLKFRMTSPCPVHFWAMRLAKLVNKTEDWEQKVRGASALLNYYSFFGFWERSFELILHVDEMPVRCQLSPLTKAWWYISCAVHYQFSGKAGIALSMLRDAQELVKTSDLDFLEPLLNLLRLYTYLGKGEIDSALPILQALGGTVERSRPFEWTLFNMARAWHALLLKQPMLALECAQTALHSATTLKFHVFKVYAELILLMAFIQNRDFDKAEDLYRRFCAGATQLGSYLFHLHVHLLGARFAIEKQDALSGTQSLLNAFGLLREYRLLTNLVWLPDEMAHLCTRALENSIEVAHVSAIIRARKLIPIQSRLIEEWPWPLKIYSFGAFSIHKDGEPLTFSGKAQRKPLEFMKALVALGGHGVDAAIITELLWPEAEGDAAQRSFDSTLHRLRKLVGHEDAILLSDRKVSLNTHLCWVDAWEFEQIISVGIPSDHSRGEKLANLSSVVDRVLRLYRADFLQLEEMQPWILSTRDKLRSKLLRFIAAVGQSMEQAGNWESAIDLYKRGIETDCLAEELYRRLIVCQRQQGNIAEAVSVYRRCREMLSIVLGIAPSAKTNTLYRELLEQS